MLNETRQKLAQEIDQLTYELNVSLPKAIQQAVELGDLRENSEYKAALERQRFVQARLSQLHTRMQQVQQLANTEVPHDRVGLGSKVRVRDLQTDDIEDYEVVLPEMMDLDAGHISLASPLGRALSGRAVGEEVQLKLPTMTRKLKILQLVTLHEAQGQA